MQSSDNDHSLRIRGHGRIEFSDDDADVKSVSEGGYLEIEERTSSGTARVEFASRAGGGVERRWWKDGRAASFEPEGRAWVARRLPDILRRTGLGAGARVERILQRQGPGGVLDEVSRIPSDFVKGRYLAKLLAAQSLDRSTLTRLIVQTGREMKSDFERCRVLIAVAHRGVPPDDAAIAYVDATRTMRSDFERQRALAALVEAGTLHPSTLKVLLDTATTMKSDFELSRLLIAVVERQHVDATTERAYFGAVGTFRSDFERHRALSALLSGAPLPESMVRGILDSTMPMHSAFDASNVLIRVAQTQRVEGNLRQLYIAAADKLQSQHDRDRALAALAHHERAARD